MDDKAEIELLIGRNAPELLKVRAFCNRPNGTPWAHKLAIGWTICGQACIDRQGGPVHIGTHRTICHDKPEPTCLQTDVNFNEESSSLREIIHYKSTPCLNSLTVQESFSESKGHGNVYHTTDNDNESTMSIEDRRFVEIMMSQTHMNQAGHWEMPLPPPI